MRGRERDRKRAFRAALELEGLTLGQWAEREGYNVTHVSLVLNGGRVSGRLTEKLDAFIREQLPHIRVAQSA